jgi:hypothetical protein
MMTYPNWLPKGRSRKKVLEYVDIERQYQDYLGRKGGSIEEELDLAEDYLREAYNWLDKGEPQMALRQMRRIAANFVRAHENHQVLSDQQEQRDLLNIAQEKLWRKQGY